MQRFTVLVVGLCGVLLSAVTSTLLAQDKENVSELAKNAHLSPRIGLVAPKPPVITSLPDFLEADSFSAALWNMSRSDNPGIEKLPENVWQKLQLQKPTPGRLSETHKPVLLKAGVVTTETFLGVKWVWRRGRRIGVGVFHFQTGPEDYALYLDKYGHFLGGYFLARTVGELHNIAFSREKATLFAFVYGSVGSLLTEVNDGYLEGSWSGFSKPDAIADVLGAGVGALYVAHPSIADYFEFKIAAKREQFHNGEWARMMRDLAPDYRKQVYYAVVKGKKILPKPLSMVNLAVGVNLSARRNDGTHRREWSIALDIDVGKLPALNKAPVVRTLLNGVHLPFLPSMQMH